MFMVGDCDYYYESDCDMFFLPGWFEKMIYTYQAFGEFGILGGRKHNAHADLGHQTIGGYEVIWQNTQAGLSMFFSKEVWDKVGKFVELESDPKSMGLEDGNYCDRAIALGYRIATVTPPVVLHCGILNTFNEPTSGADDELKQPFPEGVKYGIFD